ncbi:hypothetical protein [Noviherbaspirillum album]|uniref:hypothetical protein n=1 Tax=Noviherbaspirillum album TaxID=3080276 RepID=UPI002DD65E14|nr:hypothetical protein [Noviherbaspirillum sp. CPCC 100848]
MTEIRYRSCSSQGAIAPMAAGHRRNPSFPIALRFFSHIPDIRLFWAILAMQAILHVSAVGLQTLAFASK